MNLDPRLRDALLIFAITGVALYIFLPKSTGIKKPAVASDKEVNKVKNAQVILDAYLNAKEAREPASELAKLNQVFLTEYGMKVVQNKQGKYVARTTSGEDVLMVK